jgi:hypothetical protein
LISCHHNGPLPCCAVTSVAMAGSVFELCVCLSPPPPTPPPPGLLACCSHRRSGCWVRPTTTCCWTAGARHTYAHYYAVKLCCRLLTSQHSRPAGCRAARRTSV